MLEYLNYRLTNLFIVRRKDKIVSKVIQCHQKRNEKLSFEDELQIQRKISRLSKRTIEIKDFGAGSKKMGNIRSISTIYKTSVASIQFQRFLYHLVESNKSVNILEMGTSLGFSSVYLAKASPGKLTTIEACPETAHEASTLFSEMVLPNLTLINSTFVHFFKKENTESYDLIYIDGHHDGKALLEYIAILKPQMKENAVVVVDDIRWSDSMNKSWKTLIKDPYFVSYIDLFRMGVLVVNDQKE
jgi:hypothetical protein